MQEPFNIYILYFETVPALRRNKMRVAEVWMDDYKYLFHVAIGKGNIVSAQNGVSFYASF